MTVVAKRLSPRARIRRSRGQCLGILLAWVSLFTTAQAGSFQARSFPELSLPDAMHAQSVADAMQVNGIPTHILAFDSPQSIDALASYFKSQWDDMRRRRAQPWTVLAHRDGDWLTTVQIKKAALGHTRGFIALSPLFGAIKEGQTPPKIDLPMLHRTQPVEDLQSVDHGKASRTLILRSHQSASQTLDFYRAYFKAQGYVPAGPRALVKGEAGGAMLLNRGNEQLNLAATQNKHGSLITIIRVQKP